MTWNSEKEPRIVASVEARMGSSRFPGKMLADVCGKPAIERLFNRLKRSSLVTDVVLATTVSDNDKPLVEWAGAAGIPFYRGSEEDVLLRVVEAHRKMSSDIVVEVTGDCILLDPAVIDMGIDTFLNNDCDVVTNVRRLSFPMGVDVQVFPLSILAEVERETKDPAVREHVSLYFYEHPEKYRIIHLRAPQRWHAPDCRFQMDYREDYEFIQSVYRSLLPVYGENFGTEEIMELLRRDAGLLNINRNCREKAVR